MRRIGLALLGIGGLALSQFGSIAPMAAAERVSVAGGPIGGTYYVLATGFAKLLNDNLGLNAAVEATGGSEHNVKLVDSGQAEFGLVNGGAYDAGLTGKGWAEGKKHENSRVLFAIMPGYLHFWSPASAAVVSIDDLSGKVVNFSQKGSGADMEGVAMVELFNLKPSRVTNVNHSQANQMMQDGLLHASLTLGGLPHPAVASLAAVTAVNVIGIGGDKADAYIKARPYMSKGVIPAGTYQGQDKSIDTLKDWNLMIVNKDQPEEKVYELMRMTFANIDKWAEVHRAAGETKLENIKDLTAYPLHPGALRFYREHNILP